MTSANGISRSHMRDPPQSSMLATHVVNKEASGDLSHDNFMQLIQESLGTDEHGQSNLSQDETVNSKLIIVIMRLGIQPFLSVDNDDPFRKRLDQGKTVAELNSCLEVIALAVNHSPRVLYKSIEIDRKADATKIPLFAWVLPELLTLSAQSSSPNLTQSIWKVIEAAVEIDCKSFPSNGGVIIEFLQNCLTAIQNQLSVQGQWDLSDEMNITEDELAKIFIWQPQLGQDVASRLGLSNASQFVATATKISRSLLKPTLPREYMTQVRKQISKLHNCVQESCIQDHSEPDFEILRADIESLQITTVNERSGSAPEDEEDEDDEEWPDSGRARKRPRLSNQLQPSTQEAKNTDSGIKSLTLRMAGRAVTDLEGLAATASFHFQQLTELEQCEAIALLGQTACLLAFPKSSTLPCRVCDDYEEPGTSDDNGQHIDDLLRTLIALSPYYDRRTQARVFAIDAFRRVISHTNTATFIKFQDSFAGKLILQSLRSISRDARITAARALQAYVRMRPGRSSLIVHNNRVAVLEYVQSLSQKAQPMNHEAVIVALIRMAQAVDNDDELNIILLRLIDYLGHPNPYIASLATSEIQQLAQHLQTNVQALFRPFWRTLSLVIIKNINSRPVIAQQICDLIGMPITGLLQIMEEHALPYLVLNKNVDIISRIASSGSSPVTAFELCIKSNNLPKIISFLLAQGFSDPEESIMALLVAISEDFGEQDLSGWISLNPSQIACELLKAAGDTGQTKTSKIYQGIQVLAQLSLRKSNSGSKRSDHTATFLEVHALAILTQFTVKLDNSVIKEPNVERRRCLIALGEMVRLGKSRTRAALPQICACLRSAIMDNALCDSAFSAWATMTFYLGEDELVDVLEQTFAVVVRLFDQLGAKMQDRAIQMINHLFNKHEALIKDTIETLPSLASISALDEFETKLNTWKKQMDERRQVRAFVARLEDSNAAVIEQALRELVPFLRSKQDFLLRSVLREQPDSLVADLTRKLLDSCVKFNSNIDILLLCGHCLGSIGCIDSSRLEDVREKPNMTVLSNFAMANETTAFLMFFMEQVIVKEYVSASSLRSKGFLGWALQELLKLCELAPDITSRTRVGGLNTKDRQWSDLSEETRLVLTPFLTSKFAAPSRKKQSDCEYPIFLPTTTYQDWLTKLTLDFLSRGSGQNVEVIFEVCYRMVYYGRGTAISSFLLPYAALNLLLSGIDKDKEDLMTEILWILKQPLHELDLPKQETLRQCSQSVFDILDYMSVWVQEKRKVYHALILRADRGIRDPSIDTIAPQIEAVELVLKSVPPEIITDRSIECKSYARALFHWEEYIHSSKEPTDQDYRRLQDIYAQIDEPDGIEGISSRMHLLDAESQVLEHKKAGRWQAAQNWYELQLNSDPQNVDVQINLLDTLKQSGQHDVLLHHFDSICQESGGVNTRLLPYAIESTWASTRWKRLEKYVLDASNSGFTARLGSAMLAFRSMDDEKTENILQALIRECTADMTYNSTTSFTTSHDALLRLHILDDLRFILHTTPDARKDSLDVLEKRLNVLGTNVADKQYLLNIHRAIMHLKSDTFTKSDVAESWLKTAKLARKAMATNQAFDAVIRATTMGDHSAAIEQAKLTWLEGNHRKAIKTLEGAIESGAFRSHNYFADEESMTVKDHEEQNSMIAKAYVLLGKWLDQAGQTQSEVIIKTFRKSTEHNRKWEKGWYNLGRHYNKILDSEKAKPPGKESQPFLTGEAAKIVIENFLRALACGSRYLFETLPKVLTLWLELVSNAELEQDSRRGTVRFHEHNMMQRKKVINETNAFVKKYVDRLQPIALYTILPQLVARICQTNQSVHDIIQAMVVKVIRSFPQQSLWTLMAVTKSSDKVRAQRGLGVINKIVEMQKKDPKNVTPSEMRTMISAAQKFTDELLRVADYHIEGRVPKVSLARDLGFNHKIAPSKLVVPVESCLIPNIPNSHDPGLMKTFRPFSKEPATIQAFLDEALVLSSLQKPRKMSIRGSDGNIYSILAKPKDDLRKDQRLMEFNTMINRFLKRDIQASKRRLYIRTYAVVPLNEECGVLEWVDNLKTMRDVLLKLYRERNTPIDYGQIRSKLDDICARNTDKGKEFTERVLSGFAPLLRYWFVEMFPDPTAWLGARIRYTRSSAVMSIVGHILGLGDRHGENILFEEGNGGILHVDFNCLFDKGLTFDKPECVPFRLTHNMIDAFGTYGYDGPFRRCCEITLSLLRSNEDGLMTILETFLHDPTTDFMTAGKRRKTRDLEGVVPDTAEKMLEGVKGKVRGMLAGESVPLSVGGYVEEMIKQAASRDNLARMYIGWCAFL